nr:TetR/AcrR family transcriptional regulator [Lysinibacter cavernae]
MLDAAVKLFRINGFAGTSIEAVARTAGVTKRTLYVYFTDKTGLFMAAVERQHNYVASHSTDHTSLERAATAVVYALHSDDAVGLHRLVLAEAVRFPELAESFYATGPERSIAYLSAIVAGVVHEPATSTGKSAHASPKPPKPMQSGKPTDQDPKIAESLYSLLLGESHRQRMLGLRAAPTQSESRTIANSALTALRLNEAI